MTKRNASIFIYFIFMTTHIFAVTNSNQKTINTLIKALVSPNKPLNPESKTTTIILPPSYDENAQLKIKAVVKKLEGLGVSAFPALIANLKNDEYCMSYSTSLMRDFSVGDICMDILISHFSFHKNRSAYKGMPHYGWQMISINPEKWWEENKGKTLKQMKVEALKWTIEQEVANHKRLGEFLKKDKDEWDSEFVLPLKKYLKELTQNE